MRNYDNPDWTDRKIFSLALENIDSFPGDFALPTPHFVCLLAWDARNESAEAISKFADLLINRGLAYLCAWGPDCSRVHDLFDETEVDGWIGEGIVSGRKHVIMTTWHQDESLDEALWFTLICAYPNEYYTDTCGSCIAVSIGNAEWNRHIERQLANLKQLNIDVVGPDSD